MIIGTFDKLVSSLVFSQIGIISSVDNFTWKFLINWFEDIVVEFGLGGIGHSCYENTFFIYFKFDGEVSTMLTEFDSVGE